MMREGEEGDEGGRKGVMREKWGDEGGRRGCHCL